MSILLFEIVNTSKSVSKAFMIINYDLFVQNLFELLLSGNEDIFDILTTDHSSNGEVSSHQIIKTFALLKDFLNPYKYMWTSNGKKVVFQDNFSSFEKWRKQKVWLVFLIYRTIKLHRRFENFKNDGWVFSALSEYTLYSKYFDKMGAAVALKILIFKIIDEYNILKLLTKPY